MSTQPTLRRLFTFYGGTGGLWVHNPPYGGHGSGLPRGVEVFFQQEFEAGEEFFFAGGDAAVGGAGLAGELAERGLEALVWDEQAVFDDGPEQVGAVRPAAVIGDDAGAAHG